MTSSQFLAILAALLFIAQAVVPKLPVQLGWIGAATLSVGVFLHWDGS